MDRKKAAYRKQSACRRKIFAWKRTLAGTKLKRMISASILALVFFTTELPVWGFGAGTCFPSAEESAGAGTYTEETIDTYTEESTDTDAAESASSTPSEAKIWTTAGPAPETQAATASFLKKAADSDAQMEEAVQQGPGLSLLSTGNDDSSFSAKNFSSTVKDLKLSVTKKADRHFIFTITGKVLQSYVRSDIGYYNIWGAFIGFMTYGNEPKPGIGKTRADGSDPFQFYLNNEIKDKVRDEGKSTYHYRFMNQSGVYSLGDGLSGGTVITAELAPKHAYANDGCASTQESIGKIVSVTHNVPEIADKKTDLFDLVMHIEISELSDAVTGVYTGAYQNNYYSGSDPNSRWIYCRDLTDGSEQLQAAREGRVRLDFDPGEGSGGPGSVELISGNSYAPSDPIPPYGSHFVRWDGWNGTVPNASSSFRALYEENVYHILFDTAGGNTEPPFRDIPYSKVKYQFPAASKKGYVLKTWRFQG